MIATLRDVKREILPQKATDTSSDAYLLAALRQAERRFTAHVGFGFVPENEAVTLYDGYQVGIIDVDGIRLTLDRPLLSVESITNGASGALTSSDYRLVSMDGRRSAAPYGSIVLPDGAWADDTDTAGITITGVWGYHPDYALAWRSSGDTLASGVNATATTLTVADADGLDAWGISPRFSPNHLLRIGDEWLELLAVNTNTNALTVRRGVNGSTAAVHDAATAIDVWQADDMAVRAISRWVALHYTRRGAFDKMQISGMTALEFPADMPVEVARIARYFYGMRGDVFLEV